MLRGSLIKVKIYPWENEISLFVGQAKLKVGDWVVIQTPNNYLEAVNVLAIKDVKDESLESDNLFLRLATLEDLESIKEKSKKKKQTLEDCRKLVKKYGLLMKLVDCQFSFDGSKITFAFTAESRVDFRELVKELTRHFQKTVRLQQIGSRDETKQCGQLGPCGKELCCRAFLGELGNITTDLARIQHIEQRGSDRLSGVCSRLKCCLGYEAEGYEECSKKLPALGSEYRTKSGQKGRVVSWNVLQHYIDLKLEDGTIVKESFDCQMVGCSGCQFKKPKI